MPQPDRPHRPRFRETALASGLLTAEQLDLAEEAVKLIHDPRQATDSAWDKSTADVVVGWGWVTRFQADQMLEYGRTVFRLGQYTVLDEIAKGGMGHVFRAEHAMMGRQVAIKVLPRTKATPESEAAFRREMRMLGRLDHENLVRAFDAGFDAKVYYLVTELVPGIDLKRYVNENGPMDETTAAIVIAQAARGLGYAHDQGLVHRDVKPGNILVLRDLRVKVLDLGLAGSQVADEAARVERVVGTPDYMAPEQAQTPDDVGPAADIYSVGCTLYFIVTGQVPFPGGKRAEKLQRHQNDHPRPAQELAPTLSERFCRVIEDMMAKSPDDRINSAAEVIERLGPWLAEGRRRPRAAWHPGAIAGSAGAALLPGDDSSSFWNGLLPPATAASRWPFLGLFTGQPFANEVRRLGREAVSAAIVAGPIGVALGAAMMFVRTIDEEKFDSLVSERAPMYLGCGSFLAIFALQMIIKTSGRR
ncbi:MAG: serine/threonine protein kinase [Planctomycetes bacterium]|nr:serine/threonine protein kinase [Planctomycetota bacterium]